MPTEVPVQKLLFSPMCLGSGRRGYAESLVGRLLVFIQPSILCVFFWTEVGREEGDKVAFLCRFKVVAEVAVWSWEELWPKGIRGRFNRRPSPRAK